MSLDALHIFIDFDGTISTVDIGYALFARFSEQEPWVSQLMSRELHIRDYWKRVSENLREPLDDAKLDEFLRTIPIDPGFLSLMAFANEKGVTVTIVSDGFDLYIDRYLRMHGVEGVKVYSNHGELTPDGRMEIRYPYAAEGCNCFCATCKRNVVLTRSSPEERIIYIGDGVSDYCPAEHADIIFAKKKLAAYCNAERLPHYPFSTLADVERQLRLLLDRRRIRPRRQAELKRKRAFEDE